MLPASHLWEKFGDQKGTKDWTAHPALLGLLLPLPPLCLGEGGPARPEVVRRLLSQKATVLLQALLALTRPPGWAVEAQVELALSHTERTRRSQLLQAKKSV